MPIGKRKPGSGTAYEMFNDDKRAFRFSVTKPAYLKKPSSPKLLMMLIESHIFLRGLLAILVTTV